MNESKTAAGDSRDKTLPPGRQSVGANAAGTIISRFLGSAPRPVRSPQETSRDLLLAAPLFSELDAAQALAFITQERCRIVTNVPRDRIIRAADNLLFVLSGQVGLAAFDGSAATRETLGLADRAHEEHAPENKISRPLSSLTKSHICQLGPGDLIDPRAAAEMAKSLLGSQHQFISFTNTPTSYVLFTADCFAAVAALLPPLAQSALRAVIDSTHKRISESCAARNNQVDQFYMRNGLAVASTVRAVDLDKCVWCKKCEDACADRYGVSRIKLDVLKNENSLIAGSLGLAGSCRTCTDQRCVDACGYAAIRFDPDRKEVFILEDKCAGCTACANACPYHAIDMIDVSGSSAFTNKLQARLGPKKAPERTLIASKCDHCADHGGQQACIAACPEGALLELAPRHVVNLLHRQTRSGAAPGEAMGRAPAPGSSAEPVPEPPASRSAPAALRAWYWPTGLLLWLVTIAEVALRQVGHRSLFRLIEPAQLVRAVNHYYVGSPLSRNFGIFATVLLVLAMLYPLQQWLLKALSAAYPRTGLQQISSSKFHAFLGVFGAAVIITHSNGQIFKASSYNPYSIIALVAFWLMISLLLTGWLGSQLFVSIFIRRARCEERVRQIEAELAVSATAVHVVSRFLSGLRSPARVGQPGLGPSLRALRHVLRPPPLPLAEFEPHLHPFSDRAERRRAQALLAELYRVRLRLELLGCLPPLSQFIKRMHLPLALAFLLAAALHILRPN